MIFFGRRGGPMRLVWACVALSVLLLLSFVLFNLNTRLDNQQQANLASIDASDRIVGVNDDVTNQLRELTDLTHTAQTALEATAALQPLLIQLDKAITPVAELLRTNTAGAQITNQQLAGIQGSLTQVEQVIVPLVASAEKFGQQGVSLLRIVQNLVVDLKSAVDSAQTINQMLPLPG